MDLQQALDMAIKKNEVPEMMNTGYTLKKTYLGYMDNDTWDKFLQKMKKDYPQAYCNYDEGGGSELKERNYKGIKLPPKMASYGSSSRMMFAIGKDISDLTFEKRFPTSIGAGQSELDGYIKRPGISYCIEAKCREPYGGSHKGEKRSIQYKELLDFINHEHIGMTFTYDIIDEKNIAIDSSSSIPIAYFDIMQLIAHFCGIANQLFDGNISKDIHFIYLIFNPSYLPESCFEKNMKEKVLERYHETLREMESIPMDRLFATIYKHISKKHTCEKTCFAKYTCEKDCFTFSFMSADQTNFKDFIK